MIGGMRGGGGMMSWYDHGLETKRSNVYYYFTLYANACTEVNFWQHS